MQIALALRKVLRSIPLSAIEMAFCSFGRSLETRLASR